MAMNRIQFQPGLSLAEFLKRFATQAACRRALRRARWPKGFVCPECKGHTHSRFKHRGNDLWQCSACRHQTSLVAGTVFADTKLPLTTWFLALYLLTQSKTNVAAMELMRHLGVCYRTAWRLKHKLMQSMTAREATRRLGGLVQIDDAYLGGKLPGGKAGRGSENKQAFVIAVSTCDQGHPRHAVIDPLATFSKDTIEVWAKRRLEPRTEVYSDGLGAFRAVAGLGHIHSVIVSDSPRAATEAADARWVNVVLGNVKRALDGTYHSIRQKKYAHRYLGEAAYRFNRRFDLRAMVPRLLVAAAVCQPWSESMLRTATEFGG